MRYLGNEVGDPFDPFFHYTIVTQALVVSLQSKLKQKFYATCRLF